MVVYCHCVGAFVPFPELWSTKLTLLLGRMCWVRSYPFLDKPGHSQEWYVFEDDALSSPPPPPDLSRLIESTLRLSELKYRCQHCRRFGQLCCRKVLPSLYLLISTCGCKSHIRRKSFTGCYLYSFTGSVLWENSTEWLQGFVFISTSDWTGETDICCLGK